MSTTERICDSEVALQKCIGELRTTWNQHKYVRVAMRIGKSRSLKQNSHSHAWYGQLERELPEDDAKGWKRFCKLHFGVPILRAEEPEFRAMYDAKLRALPYETKLTLMEWVPVTSLMTKAQLQKYEKAMQDHFDPRGVKLEYPPEDEAPKRRTTAKRGIA